MLGPEFRIYIVHPYLDASAPPVFYPSSNSCQDRLPIVSPGQAAAIYALLIQFRNSSYMCDIATLRPASDERARATLRATESSEMLMRCLVRETLVATNSQIVYATIALESRGTSGSGGSRAANGYFVRSGVNRRETTDRAHDPQAVPFTDPMRPLATTVPTDVNTLPTLSDRIQSSSPARASPDLQH